MVFARLRQRLAVAFVQFELVIRIAGDDKGQLVDMQLTRTTEHTLITCVVPEHKETSVGNQTDGQCVLILVEHKLYHQVLVLDVIGQHDVVGIWLVLRHCDGLDGLNRLLGSLCEHRSRQNSQKDIPDNSSHIYILILNY